METIEIPGADWKAARLLAGLGVGELSEASGVSHDTIQRLEAGRRIRPKSIEAVYAVLMSCGVSLEGGRVLHQDGRVAPTLIVAGVFHGERIRRARWRLAWSLPVFAQRTGLSVTVLRKLERSKDLHREPCLSFYRAVGELQRNGAIFSRQKHGGIDGDWCLLPRPVPEHHKIREMLALARHVSAEIKYFDRFASILDPEITVDGEPSMRGKVPRSPRESYSGKKALEDEFESALGELGVGPQLRGLSRKGRSRRRMKSSRDCLP
ncbi:MAG: helix-turn-helix domain-containing protein [Phenylobacterium sp.]|nr:helix-turn-helix domain-containing protein [Phenylobacterium sp.]